MSEKGCTSANEEAGAGQESFPSAGDFAVLCANTPIHLPKLVALAGGTHARGIQGPQNTKTPNQDKKETNTHFWKQGRAAVDT